MEVIWNFYDLLMSMLTGLTASIQLAGLTAVSGLLLLLFCSDVMPG